MQNSGQNRGWLVLLGAIGGISLVSLVTRGSGAGVAESLVWFPGAVEAGQWWRMLSNALVLIDPLSLFFELLFLYFVAPSVEEDWGTGWLLGYFVIASVGATGMAMLLSHLGVGIPFLFGPGAALLGFIYIFSKRNPDQYFLLFFVIPIKARWFVVGYVAMRVVFSIQQPILLMLLVAELAGALFGLAIHWLVVARSDRAGAARRARLTVVEETSGIEKENAALLASVEKNAAHPATAEKLLVAERTKTFDFKICPPADFSRTDKYCRKCAAFGHCLAREHDTSDSGY